MAEVIEVMQNVPENTSDRPRVRLYWIGVEIAKRRKIDILEETGDYTDAGEAIKRKVDEKIVPVQLQIVDRMVTMPKIGEPLLVPEHLVREYMDRGRVYGKNGERYEGFTTSEDFAKVVRKAYEQGKPTPTNLQAVVQQGAEDVLNSLSVEELQARLEQLQGHVKEEEEDTSSSSRSSSKSKKTTSKSKDDN